MEEKKPMTSHELANILLGLPEGEVRIQMLKCSWMNPLICSWMNPLICSVNVDIEASNEISKTTVYIKDSE